MRTITVLALVLCSDVFGAAGSSVEEVRGVSGGSLTVHCRYSKGFVQHKQYWCKGDYWRSCSIIVQTSGSEKEVTEGRFTIKDNHRTHTFTVTITGLKEADSGLYWCGTERWGTDNMYQVKVTVSKSDTEFHQTEKPSTTIKGQSVTASVSPDKPPGPQSNTPGDKISSRVPITPSGPPCTTSAGDTEAPSASSAPERLLQSLVPAAVIGMLFLMAVTSWLILRNRKKSPEGGGAPRDPATGLVNRPPQVEMLENPLYASVEDPGAIDSAPVYSRIERVPHSAPPDIRYEEIQALYSEVTAPANSSVRRQSGAALRAVYELVAPAEGQDTLYENVNQ